MLFMLTHSQEILHLLSTADFGASISYLHTFLSFFPNWFYDERIKYPLFLSEMPLCRTLRPRLRVLLFRGLTRLQMP